MIYRIAPWAPARGSSGARNRFQWVIPVGLQPLASLARPLGPAARGAGPSAGSWLWATGITAGCAPRWVNCRRPHFLFATLSAKGRIRGMDIMGSSAANATSDICADQAPGPHLGISLRGAKDVARAASGQGRSGKWIGHAWCSLDPLPLWFYWIRMLNGRKADQMTASPKPPSRHLAWGGLAARCSECGWTRIYRPGAVAHQFPDRAVSDAIHAEFGKHKCEDFPAKAPPR